MRLPFPCGECGQPRDFYVLKEGQVIPHPDGPIEIRKSMATYDPKERASTYSEVRGYEKWYVKQLIDLEEGSDD